MYTTKSIHQRRSVRAALFALVTIASAFSAHAQSDFLYVETNNVREGQNSILAYECLADGSLRLHADGPFFTGGPGIDNNTNGKLGPHDNDTPLVVTSGRERLYAVNGHSDTIAAFDIRADGSPAARRRISLRFDGCRSCQPRGSRDLTSDGASFRARPQGVVAVTLD